MLKTFAEYWLAFVSGAGAIVALVGGLSQGSRLWTIIAFVGLGFAGFMAWNKKREDAERDAVEYKEEIESYLQSLAVEYVPLVEKIYTQRYRMAAITATDEQIFDLVKHERPKLNDDALREAIRGWRAQREQINKIWDS